MAMPRARRRAFWLKLLPFEGVSFSVEVDLPDIIYISAISDFVTYLFDTPRQTQSYVFRISWPSD